MHVARTHEFVCKSYGANFDNLVFLFTDALMKNGKPTSYISQETCFTKHFAKDNLILFKV